jgi:hypothetical protein
MINSASSVAAAGLSRRATLVPSSPKHGFRCGSPTRHVSRYARDVPPMRERSSRRPHKGRDQPAAPLASKCNRPRTNPRVCLTKASASVFDLRQRPRPVRRALSIRSSTEVAMRIFERLRGRDRSESNIERKPLQAIAGDLLHRIADATEAAAPLESGPTCCSCCSAEAKAHP